MKELREALDEKGGLFTFRWNIHRKSPNSSDRTNAKDQNLGHHNGFGEICYAQPEKGELIKLVEVRRGC